jgi:orotidine-5'-phosphate decarboxylase
MTNRLTARDRLIVALDVENAADAHQLVKTLGTAVRMFKVGSQLFTVAGPDVVTGIIKSGNQVFLDLKFHDIPHQVSGAVASATRLGVSLMTIHASGGLEMMKRAVASAHETSSRVGIARPSLVAVTVLTSMDNQSLNQIGMMSNSQDAVIRLAKLAQEAGTDGVVASPQEAANIRNGVAKSGFLIVTPGIRPGASSTHAADDQRRVATPESAIRAGADYLVVGRPITGANDPSAAAEAIINEIEFSVAGESRGTVQAN